MTRSPYQDYCRILEPSTTPLAPRFQLPTVAPVAYNYGILNSFQLQCGLP